MFPLTIKNLCRLPVAIKLEEVKQVAQNNDIKIERYLIDNKTDNPSKKIVADYNKHVKFLNSDRLAIARLSLLSKSVKALSVDIKDNAAEIGKKILQLKLDDLELLNILSGEISSYQKQCNSRNKCQCYMHVVYLKDQPIGFIYTFHNPESKAKSVIMQSIAATIPFYLAKKLYPDISTLNYSINRILMPVVYKYAQETKSKYIFVYPTDQHQYDTLMKYYDFKFIGQFKASTGIDAPLRTDICPSSDKLGDIADEFNLFRVVN